GDGPPRLRDGGKPAGRQHALLLRRHRQGAFQASGRARRRAHAQGQAHAHAEGRVVLRHGRGGRRAHGCQGTDHGGPGGGRPLIDQRAVVSAQAELAEDVDLGPYSVVGPGVEIGSGTRIGAHVVVSGPCRIGRDNRIHPFCAVGGEAQDKKYRGEQGVLEIGDRNTIREYCTLNRGTAGGGGATRVGNDNWI